MNVEESAELGNYNNCQLEGILNRVPKRAAGECNDDHPRKIYCKYLSETQYPLAAFKGL